MSHWSHWSPQSHFDLLRWCLGPRRVEESKVEEVSQNACTLGRVPRKPGEGTDRSQGLGLPSHGQALACVPRQFAEGLGGEPGAVPPCGTAPEQAGRTPSGRPEGGALALVKSLMMRTRSLQDGEAKPRCVLKSTDMEITSLSPSKMRTHVRSSIRGAEDHRPCLKVWQRYVWNQEDEAIPGCYPAAIWGRPWGFVQSHDVP
jgi:hypothetical protein